MVSGQTKKSKGPHEGETAKTEQVESDKQRARDGGGEKNIEVDNDDGDW